MSECDLLCVKMIILGACALVAVVGVLLPIWISSKEKPTAVGMLISGGILLAASLCHLLADASTEIALTEDKFPWAQFAFGSGYLFILSIETAVSAALSRKSKSPRCCDSSSGPLSEPLVDERSELVKHEHSGCDLIHVHEGHLHGDEGGKTMLKIIQRTGTAGPVILVSLTVHSLIEGFALGAQRQIGQVVVLAVAIVFHKGFAAFALSAALKPIWRTPSFNFICAVFCLATPVGVGAAVLLEQSITTFGTAVLGAFCAGTLMNVAVCEIMQVCVLCVLQFRAVR